MSKERVAPREATPLSFEHFNFLWFLLIFGYGIATLVFIIEMLCEGKKSSRKIMKPKDNP